MKPDLSRADAKGNGRAGSRHGSGTQDLSLTHHHRQFEVMGAQPTARGTWFTVWAPNARSVGVIGAFNGWHCEPLNRLGDGSGRWSRFIDNLVPTADIQAEFERFRFDGEPASTEEVSLLSDTPRQLLESALAPSE